MKGKLKQTHRLLITIEDKSKPRITKEGNQFIPVKTIEVVELNLGSIVKPTKICKQILSIKLEPIRHEQ